MCGRYTITHSTEEILDRFKLLSEKIDIDPNYNVAPTHNVPVVVAAPETDENGEPTCRLLQFCKWGLVPFWAKDGKPAKPLINARAESLTEKNVFKKAFFKRRCVIPADGFYEWKRSGNKKVPMRIHFSDDRLFGFAGIYQDVKNEDGSTVRTVSIITVPASERVSDIHDRMPAILNLETEKVWLNTEIEDEVALRQCLQPYTESDLVSYVVSSSVNKTSVNNAELLQETTEAEDSCTGEENEAAPKRARAASPKKKQHEETPGQLKLFS